MAQHQVILKNETITLSLGNNGYWLYDKTRGIRKYFKTMKHIITKDKLVNQYDKDYKKDKK